MTISKRVLADVTLREIVVQLLIDPDEEEVRRLILERADVPRILPHLACLWLGSEYEGQSNAVMEGMAASLPIVATDIPGNRDLVVPSETGYLVPVGDRGEFARWTKVLLEDVSLAERYGAAGRERMLREFSVEQMLARHAELYAGLVANG